MVNRGSKEAVWQPAPEDIENEIPTDEYITQITKNTVTTSYVEALNITDVGTTLENAKSNSYFVDEIDTIYIDRMLLCSYMQISDTKYSQEVNEWLENKFRK